MQGKLIVIEGTDGSGKATQSELLCQELTRRGVPYRKLTFPRYQEESSALVRLYLGGAFGILLGYAAVTAGMALMGVAPVIDGSTIAFLMLFSMATGVLFGVYPALKASRLRPVDALRME